MSGSADTSASNCVLNFLLTAYLVLRTRYPHASSKTLARSVHQLHGLFEGDDGVIGVAGIDRSRLSTIVGGLGIKLKFAFHADFSTAAFCGILQPRECEGTILTDPKKILCNFFVIPPRFMNAKKSKQDILLRAKALSYLYQYPDCPVVSRLAHTVLSKTKSVTVVGDELDHHRSFILKEALESIKTSKQLQKPPFWAVVKPITYESRRMCEDLFDCPVEWQLETEAALDAWARGDSASFPIPCCAALERYAINGVRQLQGPATALWNSTSLPDPRADARRWQWFHPASGQNSDPDEIRRLKKMTLSSPAHLWTAVQGD